MKFSVELPRGYRGEEILRFHGRDAEGMAERVTDRRILKGVVVDAVATVVDIQLEAAEARCEILADERLSAMGEQRVEGVVKSMLGLWIEPGKFERAVRGDVLLGKVVQRHKGLRIPQTGTVFEAVTWAVMGQQISVAFAMTLRRAFIELAGRRHSSGLWCYPDAGAVVALTGEALGLRKFSRAKAETILRVARMVENGELDLEGWRGVAADGVADIETALLGIKGIGPWTAHYTMLRGVGCADCSLHGDAAIRSRMGKLQGRKVEMEEAREVLEKYRPWRSLAAAHLWASSRMGE